jgi:hypothetical protein
MEDAVIVLGVGLAMCIAANFFLFCWANDLMKAVLRLKRILDSHGIYD